MDTFLESVKPSFKRNPFILRPILKPKKTGHTKGVEVRFSGMNHTVHTSVWAERTFKPEVSKDEKEEVDG